MLTKLNRRVTRALADGRTRAQFWMNRRPTIVLGNQKSGTTAIAALLGKISGLPATLDVQGLIARPKLHRVRTGDVSFEQIIRENLADFARPIIKDPSLTFFYRELRSIFPKGRFVFVIRDPRDNIRSILDRLRLAGNQEELTNEQWQSVPHAWKFVFDDSWETTGRPAYIESMARRWRAAAKVYLDSADQMLLARYEDFCQDKAGTVAKWASALGLPVRHDISGDVDLPYQPPGNRNVSLGEFFGARNLARIEEVCGPAMSRFGYAAATTAVDPWVSGDRA